MVNNNWASTQVHQKGDNKWESTHVHWTHPLHQTEDNNWVLIQIHRMEDNKWELTRVHTQRRAKNGNQPMSTKLILLWVWSHRTVGKRWDKTYKIHWCWVHMIIKGCGHNMVDNKWESTHVYWAHLTKRGCENSIQRVGSRPISIRLMRPQQQIWSYQMASNKWTSTHVYQTHTAALTTKDDKWESTHVYYIYQDLVLWS